MQRLLAPINKSAFRGVWYEPFRHRLARSRTIAVVGNGEVSDPSSIDSADIVVRFNKAPHCGTAGRRTDILVLVSWSGPGDGFASHPERVNALARDGAKSIWLTNHPEDVNLFRTGRECDVPGDFSRAIRKKIIRHRPYRFMPASNRIEVSKQLVLQGARNDVIPTTGAQAINLLLQEAPKAEILLYGFSFEGWAGHCWHAERRWVDSISRARFG